MARSRSRLPLVLALAASGVLHVFLFRELREAPPPQAPPASSLVELEIRTVTRPPAPVVQAPAPPAPAPIRPRPKRVPGAPAAQAPRVAEAPPASSEDPAPAPAASYVPSAPSQALTSDFPVRRDSLLPRVLPADPARGLPEPLAGTSGKDPGTGAPGTRLRAPEPQDPGDALRALVAQQRVRSGFVHTYFGQLQDVLLAAWRASGTSSRRKSGRACEVEVRLVQAPSGRLQEVSIRFPSCDPRMDEELLSDLRAAAASLPAPPPEVVGSRDSVRSVYRFSFQPPPTLPPLEFDVVSLVDRKAIPSFNPKRVTLVSVE